MSSKTRSTHYGVHVYLIAIDFNARNWSALDFHFFFDSIITVRIFRKLSAKNRSADAAGFWSNHGTGCKDLLNLSGVGLLLWMTTWEVFFCNYCEWGWLCWSWNRFPCLFRLFWLSFYIFLSSWKFCTLNIFPNKIDSNQKSIFFLSTEQVYPYMVAWGNLTQHIQRFGNCNIVWVPGCSYPTTVNATAWMVRSTFSLYFCQLKHSRSTVSLDQLILGIL